MTRYGQGAKTRRNEARASALVAVTPTQRLVIVGLLALLVFLVASYLVFLNSLTKKTFVMSKLQGTVAELQQENRRLEVEIAQRESIANLADRVDALGMVPTDKMEYVTVGSGEVALR